MADLSDVLQALRDAVAAALAEVGMVQPSQTWKGTRVYVGWPDATLDADLKAGITQVTIWPRTGMARQIDPYMGGWTEQPPVAPSLTVAVADDAVTFAGNGTVPGMIAAVIVDRAKAYTYPMQAGDGPAEVAAAFAALISADRTATAAGAVLTVPGAHFLVARVVSGGAEVREIRRVAQSIQISAWTPSPALRDAVVRAIDEALMEERRVLPMPDGTTATLTYEGTAYDEAGRQQPLHRRDLFVSAEYATVRTRTGPRIAVPVTELEALPSRIRQTILS